MSSASVAWPSAPTAFAELAMREGDGTLSIAAHAEGSPVGGSFDLVLSASAFCAEARFDGRYPERSTASFAIDVRALRVASLRRSGEPASLALAVPSAVVERVHALLASSFGPTIRVEVDEGVRSGAARYSFVAHLLRDGGAIPFPLDVTVSPRDDGEVEVRGKGEASLVVLASPPIDLAAKAFRVRDRVAVELAIRLRGELAPGRGDPRRG